MWSVEFNNDPVSSRLQVGANARSSLGSNVPAMIKGQYTIALKLELTSLRARYTTAH